MGPGFRSLAWGHLGEEAPYSGEKRCKATVGKKERPRLLFMPVGCPRETRPASHPYSEPTRPIQSSRKMSQTKVCICEEMRSRDRGRASGDLVLHKSTAHEAPARLGPGEGEARERHGLSMGKGAEAGDSQASERGFEFSYLDSANSPCSEGEELRWGPE